MGFNNQLFYLTLNENVGGIFQSQVIDVIKLYEKNNVNITLICFISMVGFKINKVKIKELLPEAVVLPAVPKLKYFMLNKYLLRFVVKKNSTVICRNTFATILAQSLKNTKVIYDGRGAITAEQDEYKVYNNTGIENKIKELEQKAVLESDFRIAVTNKLIKYWEDTFGYKQNKHVIIPCTLANHFLLLPGLDKINELKKRFNITESDIVLSFVGGNAEWQSFGAIRIHVNKILQRNLNCKVIFVSKTNIYIQELQKAFPKRVYQVFVNPKEVPDYLDISDYGILYREDTITNRVASPVKCAEYLSRGLKVLISDNIGDYSETLLSNNMAVDITKIKELSKPTDIEQLEIKEYAIKYFSKYSKTIQDSYLKLALL
jgi:hypothetical protein